jgi:hypothetical protein
MGVKLIESFPYTPSVGKKIMGFKLD